MNRLLLWISDLLWPLRCVACDVAGQLLCGRCRGMLPRRPQVTRHPSEHVDLLVSGAPLSSSALSRAVWYLKYRNARELAPVLAQWLADGAGPLIKANTGTMLVPVPLHVRRERERGYNQAALLSAALSRISALPMETAALTRVRATTSQVKTEGRVGRIGNMRGAFRASDAVRGRHIVLVDDVSTTGATLDDCARALKQAGARRVSALVLARG